MWSEVDEDDSNVLPLSTFEDEFPIPVTTSVKDTRSHSATCIFCM